MIIAPDNSPFPYRAQNAFTQPGHVIIFISSRLFSNLSVYDSSTASGLVVSASGISASFSSGAGASPFLDSASRFWRSISACLAAASFSHFSRFFDSSSWSLSL